MAKPFNPLPDDAYRAPRTVLGSATRSPREPRIGSTLAIKLTAMLTPLAVAMLLVSLVDDKTIHGFAIGFGAHLLNATREEAIGGISVVAIVVFCVLSYLMISTLERG